MKYLGMLVLLIVSARAVTAEGTSLPFKDGEVVCFVGDSITHDGRYLEYISNYYLTRFPDRRIRFFNCGIAGDDAHGALQRLAWDVLSHKPTSISVMLGMNDVQRDLYGQDKIDEETLGKRARALGYYQKNMTALLEDMVSQVHPQMILITPSPYDQTAELAAPNFFGVNDALAQCGDMVEKLAQQFDATVVDFHAVMSELNAEHQKNNPQFTLIGGDRIHPGAAGHLIMAYLFLKAQGAPSVVSKSVLDARNGRMIECENAEIHSIFVNASCLEWECLEKALPFPIPAAAHEVPGWIPLEAELNQQILKVAGLKPGMNQLLIDKISCGQYSDQEFQEGILLGFNSKTPQYQQAQKVLSLNEKRTQMEIRVRNMVKVELVLRYSKISLDDNKAVSDFFVKFQEERKSPYYEALFADYFKTKMDLAKITSEMEQLDHELMKQNQPISHHYEIRPVVK